MLNVSRGHIAYVWIWVRQPAEGHYCGLTRICYESTVATTLLSQARVFVYKTMVSLFIFVVTLVYTLN